MHNIMLRNYCDFAGSGAALQETMIILVKSGPPRMCICRLYSIPVCYRKDYFMVVNAV